MLYEAYGKLHQTVKKLLGRSTSQTDYRMVSVTDLDFDDNGVLNGEGKFFNEEEPGKGIKKGKAYPIENIVSAGDFPTLKDSFRRTRKCSEKQLGVNEQKAEELWKAFISHSAIHSGYRNAGLHYAGYILDCESWCLPSWVWTNAAIIRTYCKTGEIEKAKDLSNILISKQESCGGWIVRNDYDAKGAVPVLAPNDSAYAANNGCLEVYLKTGEKKYLEAAVRCGEWIIETAREDGMVYVGYDTRENRWQTKHNIVDVGFTAGLFARLYQVTNEERYKEFLKKFTERYISLFYIPSSKGFATSLNANDQQLGGMFGRGQAWALEGLIPAYRVLNDDKLKTVIDNTVNTLLRLQDKCGGWAYNLSRPLMGIDGKATPIIALSLAEWSADQKVNQAVKRAYNWTIEHTSPDGNSAGGIFSYTTEGAIVHHLYTWTAFVYSSAYAIELKRKVEGLDIRK